MNRDVRDCVLAVVAGMRGEKRAARFAAVKQLLSPLRRGASLLTGSRLRRLEANRAKLIAARDAAQRRSLDIDSRWSRPPKWPYPPMGEIAKERRAVNAARLITGLGALGLGAAGAIGAAR